MRFFRGLGAFAIGLTAVFASAYLSSMFTDVTSEWYLALNKPVFMPTGKVFMIAWIIIYVLSALCVTVSIAKKPLRSSLILWAILLAFNVVWCLVFFKLHLTLFALSILLVQLATVAVLVNYYIKYTGELWIAVIPVTAWYAFALILNFAIVILN